MIYFDNAATTKVSKNALDAMMPYYRNIYGNPSSTSLIGVRANEALYYARTIMSEVLGVNQGEIIFTSGGTESDNQAIMSAARYGESVGKKHIISSKIEHHAVLNVLEDLKKNGYEITLVNVDKEGIVDIEEIKKAIRPDTVLISIMYANNEIGTIQPIKEIGEICKERGVLFHTDAVQAMGHIPIDIEGSNIDYLSLSAHKFNGPKGVGALYAKKNAPVFSLIKGGAQENKRRAGTENVPGIIGMATALKESCNSLEEKCAQLKILRDSLMCKLLEISGSHLNGSIERRLPGNVSVCFEGIVGETAILLLNERGICVSSGSACTSGNLEPSHVLLALGRDKELAQGALRFSLAFDNTMEEVSEVYEAVKYVVETLRSSR